MAPLTECGVEFRLTSIGHPQGTDTECKDSLVDESKSVRTIACDVLGRRNVGNGNVLLTRLVCNCRALLAAADFGYRG
jgi:hypothetical protein